MLTSLTGFLNRRLFMERIIPVPSALLAVMSWAGRMELALSAIAAKLLQTRIITIHRANFRNIKEAGGASRQKIGNDSSGPTERRSHTPFHDGEAVHRDRAAGLATWR
jgi:hypothetical protein